MVYADAAPSEPTIDTAYFPNTMTTSGYWSTTIRANTIVDAAWGVYFATGSVGYYPMSTESRYVRAVRGGQ